MSTGSAMDRDPGGGGEARSRPYVFILSGEPSGDLLGARLMAAMKAESGEGVRFGGVGGPAMAEQGLVSLYPLEDFSVMGLLEVLPHVLTILRRIRRIAKVIKAERPDILVTVDAPDFTLRVSKQLKGQGIPLVHYVAPSVWAWKPGRAKAMAGYLDAVLALLPFEPPYFERHGLRCRFVGHPAADPVEQAATEPAAFRETHGIDPAAPLLVVLPGSRQSEVKRLLPVFREALLNLVRQFPDLRVVLPTMPAVAARVSAAVAEWPCRPILIEGPEAKRQAFAAGGAALAASGTVAVELAAAGLPAVITYLGNPVTMRIVAAMLKVKYASLPNLILDRELQPELLQWDCKPERIAQEVGRLLGDPSARDAQIAGYREVMAALCPGGISPSQQAAREVLAILETGRQARGGANTKER